MVMLDEMSTAPVVKGQLLCIVPTGKSKEDAFYSCHGFIIFIKGLPDNLLHQTVTIRVTNIKEKFAFAMYVPPQGKDW